MDRNRSQRIFVMAFLLTAGLAAGAFAGITEEVIFADDGMIARTFVRLPEGGTYLNLTTTAIGAGHAGNRIRYYCRLIEVEAKRKKTKIPIDILRALFWIESEMTQFKNGEPLRHGTDTGIGQISDDLAVAMGWDMDGIRYDTQYNIGKSIEWLENRYKWARGVLRDRARREEMDRDHGIQGYSLTDLAVRGYNGMKNSHGHVKLFRKALKEKPWERWTR